MTRDQLELVLAREGLTRPQRTAVLEAADAYATAQAALALDALGWELPQTVMHWQAFGKVAGPACGATGPCTVVAADVRCDACRRTPAWKAAA